MRNTTTLLLLIVSVLAFSNSSIAQTVAASPNDTVICSGQSVQLNATPSPAGPYTYYWFPATGLSDPTIPNPLASPTVSTRYYVILFSGAVPVDVDSVTIRVSSSPSSITASTSDTVTCNGRQVQLDVSYNVSSCNNYTVESIPYQWISISPNTVVPLSNNNDSYDALGYDIPLGFNFNFFCNTYSIYEIDAEGYITFDPANNNNQDNAETIPDPSTPQNIIALAWVNLRPGDAGTVSYASYGQAPFRMHVISFENVPHHADNSRFLTGQIRLYETSNVIEIHIDRQELNVDHTIGIENQDGTIGYAPPGRNNQTWTTTNEAWRFVPENYAVNSIIWSPSAGLSDSSISNPSAIIDSTITYTVTVNASICPVSDSVLIQSDTCLNLNAVIAPQNTKDTTICSGMQVQLDAISDASLGVTYSWTPTLGLSDPNIRNPIATPVNTTNYILQATKGVFTEYDTISIEVRTMAPLSVVSSDSIICPSEPVQLNAFLGSICNDYNLSSIPYNSIAVPIGATEVFLNDNEITGALPVGFNFTFYCNTYTNFYINSNGYITFNSVLAGAQDAGALSNPTTPNNMIAIAWNDLNPNDGSGRIRYFTTGVSPNRRLIIDFLDIERETSLELMTGQVILYEGSNNIEMHIFELEYTNNTTQGIENIDGTAALVVPGRNDASWNVTVGEGWRFTAPNFTIPTYTYSWTPSASLNSANIDNPIANPSTSTTYQVVVTDSTCYDTASLSILVDSCPTISIQDTIICIGQSVLLDLQVTPPGSYTYNWIPAATLSDSAIRNPIASPVTTTLYTVGVSTALRTYYETVLVTVIDTSTINATASDTLVCSGNNVQLNINYPQITCTDYIVQSIPYKHSLGTTNYISLSDESMSTVLPIGFNFEFFCNTYSNFYISSNGFITFNNGVPPTPEELAIPNAAVPNNMIAFSWTDLDPSFGAGLVGFFTKGTAPNRELVVEFENVHWTGKGERVSVQLILKESSNIIEVHTTSQNFIGDEVTIGIEDASGTLGFSPPGRNDAVFNVVSGESWQFIPDQIPTWSFDWSPGTNLNDSTVANPTVLVNGSSSITLDIVVSNNSCAVNEQLTINIRDAYADITLLPDTIICPNEPVQIVTVIDTSSSDSIVDCNDYIVQPIAYNPVFLPGTVLGLGVDAMSPALPIGFNFNYYCNTYNSIYVSANGFATFSAGQPSWCCAAPTWSNNVGNPTDPDNIIALFWSSLDPTTGTIDYGVTGIAPNRRFYINFQNISHWGVPVGPGPDVLNGQILLYETTNVIELHIQSQPIYQYWNGSSWADFFHTAGIENQNGSIGHSLSGFNDTAWTAINLGIRFSPRKVPDPAPTTIRWMPTSYLSDTTILNPVATPPITMNYILELTKNTCSIYDTVNVVVYDSIIIQDSIVSVSCLGSNDGEAHAIVSGGTSPYNYLWSTGSTAPFIAGLVPGTYTVIVTDFNGCTASNSAVIVAKDTLVFDTTVSNLYCGTLGAIDLSVSGGVGPYTYLWSTGAISQDIANLTAGNYSVTVTDFDGCPDSIVFPVVVDLPFVIDSSVTIVSCLGSTDGAIDITVLNGFAPYQYRWSNGDSTEDLSGLTAGLYTITVTDSTGCSDSLSIYLAEIQVCCIDIDLNPWNVESDSTQGDWSLSSNGDSVYQDANGEPTFFVSQDSFINTTINGYFMVDAAVWDNDFIGFVFGYQTPYRANGDPDDDYEFLIFDWKSQAQAWVYGSQEGFSLSRVNGTFNDPVNDFRRHFWGHTHQPPKYEVLATQYGGGLGWVPGVSYQFTLQYNTDRIRIFINGTLIFDVAGTFQPGGFGFYNYSQEDVLYWGFSQPLYPYLEDTTHISCPGGSDGEIIVSASGGSPPYVWEWTNNINNDTIYGDTISGLVSATWTGRLLDAVGCDVSYVINLREPVLPTIFKDSTHISCFGANDGSATVTATRGSEAFSYLWQGGQTTSTINSLSPGIYRVTITDTSGCLYYDSVQINEPPLLTVSMSSYDGLCYNDSAGYAIALPVGGNGGNSFVWSTGETTDSIGGLVPGTYYITVSDSNSCIAIDSANILGRPLYTTNLDSNDVSCFSFNDGIAYLDSTSNPNTPFTYLWDANAGSQTNDTAFNLTAGTYYLTITDSLGCLMEDSITINEPPVLSDSISLLNVSCNGGTDGSATVVVTGGTMAYGYLWSTGGTGSSISGLNAGQYFVTVTDANSCVVIDTVIVTQPLTLTIAKDSINVACYGDSSGLAAVNVSGGTAPYTYLWSTGSVNDTITNLIAGTYYITATDDSLCTITDSFIITQSPILQLAMDSIPASCFAATDGYAIALAVGGQSPYSYLWSDGQTTDTASALVAGMYSVTVTDSFLCQTIDSIMVTQAPAITIDIDTVPITCNGLSDGELAASGSNSIHTPFTYLWNTTDTTSSIDSLSAGWYSILVSDTNGCSMLQLINLGQPTSLNLAVIGSDASCNSFSDGSADLTATGATPPYTYLWSNGATTEDINNIAAGTYNVTVTDSVGCFDSISVVINEPLSLSIAQVVTQASCEGASDGAVDITVSGGTATYNYFWSNGVVTEDISSLSPGLYTVTVTDFLGCVEIETYTVTANLEPALASSSVYPQCDSANGSIDIRIGGGSGTYSYLWSSGQTTQDIVNLTSGLYSVIVTDVVTGCVVSDTFDLYNAGNITINATVVDASNCGFSDGFILTTVSGGSGSFTYNWSHGQNGPVATNLSLGIYTITVTDNNTGCQGIRSIFVSEDNQLTIDSLITHATCVSNDGVINITPNNGSGSYSYLWSNNSSTQDINSLYSGFYEVTVTDLVTGCQQSESYIVNESGGPLLTASATDITCPTLNNGSIDLTVAGLPGPFTYSWSNGATTEDISGLEVGTYLVTVIDSASGCQNLISADVSVPQEVHLTFNAVMVNCFGESNGSIDLEVFGGISPYTYSWTGGGTSQDTMNLTAGLYTINLLDSNSCSYNGSVNITQPSQLVLDTSIIRVSCFGGNDGSIDLSVSGGIAPYTYLWSTGATTEDISSLTTGNYSVTVTDFNGCVDSLNLITIIEPAVLVLDTSIVNITCFGSSTGQISVLPSGGTAPYSYIWGHGPTSSSINSLVAGLYNVTVTDASGCSDSLIIRVTQPSQIVTDSIRLSNVNCFGGSDAWAVIFVSGGSLPYSYSWSNGSTSDSIINVIAGSYSVTVIDVYGCNLEDTVVITEPADMVLSSVITSVDCYGYNTGDIDLSISGGVGPFSYNWSTGESSQDIDSLIAGSYSVTVTDNNSCLDSATYVVSQSPMIDATEVISQPTCPDSINGMVDITPFGGSGPYSVQWSNGSSFEDLNPAGPGMYTYIVTDNIGCSISRNVTLSNSTNISVSVNTTNSTCGVSDGAIDLNVFGGSGSYSFNWSNGSITEDINNVSAGFYTVTISDNINSCDVIETVEVNSNGNLSLTSIMNNANPCGNNNGFILLGVAGGSGSYSYIWSNGGTNSLILNLTAGTYSVTVTDNNTLCQQVGVFTVNDVNNLTINEVITDATCNTADGSIDISIAGGSSSYTYVWSDGSISQDINGLIAGVYEVSVTDNVTSCAVSELFIVNETGGPGLSLAVNNNSCSYSMNGSIDLTVGGAGSYVYNWSNGAVTEDINSLQAGVYSVQVTDSASLCSSTIIDTVFAPEPIDLTFDVQHLLCFGDSDGSIDMTVTGGNSPYNYLWNAVTTTEDTINLTAGTYSIVVTDSLGCVDNSLVMVVSPPQIMLDTTIVGVTCFGGSDGSIDLTITGGVLPYSYIWSNGATTEDVSSLTTGFYGVTITDANGCVDSLSVLFVGTATQIVFDTTVTDVTCYNGSDGAIDLIISGGTPPYLYNWNNGSITQDISTIGSGFYSVIVTDASGCLDSLVDVFVDQPPVYTVDSVQIIDVSCNGGNDGQIAVFVSGGTMPYIYSWSNGQLNDTAFNLFAGSYNLAVFDANLCPLFDTFAVNEPVVISLASNVTDVSCNLQSDGAIDLLPSGGTLPYSYLWSNGSTTEDISGLTAGSYTVTMTDINGCSDSLTIVVNQPAVLAISASITNETCDNSSDGSIDLTASGGSFPYSYLWSEGSVTEDLNSISAGSYIVSVSDINGCSESRVFNVGVTNNLSLSYAVVNTTCGDSTGSIDLSVNNGSGSYSYSWSNGATTEDISSLSNGSYFVTVNDLITGCTIIDSTSVVGTSGLAMAGLITHASCASSDGVIVIGVAGGTGPYSISWSNGASGSVNSGLSPGLYTATATDVTGCMVSESFTVGVDNTLNISDTVMLANCNAADGAIDITISGGSGTYTYNWSNGAITEDISSLVAGTYSVTVDDVFSGCSMSRIVSVGNTGGPTLSFNVNDLSCNGLNNGSIDLTVAGGSGSYVYNWSNGFTSEDIGALYAGVYFVQVQDVNTGCISIDSVIVNEPELIMLEFDVSHVTCFGAGDASIDLTVTGGTAPYNFFWTGGVMTEDLNNVGGGTYTVLVQDLNSCVASSDVVVNEPAMIALDTNVTHISCFGDVNGSIDLIVSGGSNPFTYLWSNGSTTEDISNLAAGSYSVTVTDFNGCLDSMQAIIINEPTAIALDTNVTRVSCAGTVTGSIILIVSGGTPAYSYLWSDGDTLKDQNPTAAGTYHVTVTDANGCVDSLRNIVVDEPLPLVIDSINSTDVLCNGGNDGSAVVYASGGSPSYIYSWSSGQLNDTASNLTAGTYYVTVLDVNGCNTNDSVLINEPVTNLTYTVSNVTCFGIDNGSIITSYTGGATPYDYQWNTGDTTQNLIDLGPGNYSLTVTDALGCQDIANMTITQPSAILITYTSTSASCPGIDNATIDITVVGGVLPYSYNWSNGENTEDLDSISAGMYIVFVEDSNNCIEQHMISINSDSSIHLSHAVTLATCGESDGSIDIDVNGGSGNYTYNWSSGQTTEDIDSVAYGAYFVTVTDVTSGCALYDNFNVDNNGGPTINATIVDESTCGASDGSINLTISGGSGFYTYAWSNGSSSPNVSGLTAGTYSVTVSDFLAQCSSSEVFDVSIQTNMTLSFVTTASGCGQSNGTIDLTVNGGSGTYSYQWSNGSTTEDISGIGNGMYYVTVTDLLNGCSSQVSTSTIITVSDSSNLILNTINSNPSCPSANDGSIDLSVGGGSGVYSYSWSNGAISQDIAFIQEGVYSVVVRDLISNCVAVFLDTLNDPEQISLIVSVTNNSCFGELGGALDLTVSGGSIPYSFNWSHGPSTEDVSNLATGSYTVDILDVNNCVFSTTMGIADPPAIVFDTVVVHNLCYGDSIGSVDLTVSGGVAPYFYFWSNGVSTQDISGLTAGLYTVSVMDNNTCLDSLTVRVTEPPQLALDTNKTDVSCYGGSDGSIDLIVTGGVSPYSYNWSNGFTSEDIGVLSSGYYSVTVSDANGCVETIDSVLIDEPSELLIDSILIAHVSCFGYNDGQASALVSGGTTPYNLFWNGIPGDTAFNLTAGAYNLLVSDNQGCNAVQNFNVNQPTQITSSMTVSHITCFGGSDGDGSVMAGGGVAPFTYLWSNGQTNDSISNVTAGTYIVSITDANGCVRVDSITVNQPDSIVITLIPTNVLCNGDSTGSIIAFVTGGTTPYTYLWNDGQSSSNIINLPAGLYSISITDSRSCPLGGPATASINITEPAPLTVTLDSIDVSCPAGSDGRALATAVGGVSPYAYLWGDGQSTDTAYNLSAGYHSVNITDSNSCVISDSILLNQPSPLSINKNINNISCNGLTDGSISISPSGGTPGYSYIWSSGQTTDSIGGLSAGSYFITLTDTAGCQLVDTSQIIEPAQINISVDSFHLVCYNDSSGMAVALVSGGTAPFNFNWSTGETGDSISGLSIGNYSVTVIDQGGCADSAMFSINQPTQVSASTITLSNYNGYDVSYQGASDGSSAVIPAGGIPPYTYQWDSSANNQTTAIATGLSAGVYFVSVFDNQGCMGVSTDTLNEPPPIIVTTSVTTNYNGEDVSCFRYNDGAVIVSASGGVPPYTYQWDSAAGGGIDSFATNLYGGTYNVTVTDLNGGTALGSVTVVDPTRVVANAIVNSNYSGYGISCSGSNDGLATVSASGGVFPYDYLWSTGDTTNFTSGLTAGKYFVTAFDANSCFHVDSVIVVEPAPLTMSIDSSKVVSCNAGNDGSASVTPIGGAGPFTYNWSDGQTDSTAVNLSAGSYSVTITDGNACTAVGSLNVSEPLTLTIAVDSINVACSGASTGRVSAIASGGTPGYQYLWSNGITDSINNNIQAGLYEITVTDNNGCTAYEDVNVTEPAPFNVSHIKTDASCFGFSDGDATVQPSGGVPPYSYIWPTLNTTQSETNLVAGTYNVTVIDANNCTVIESIVINEPLQIQIALDTTGISCFGFDDGVINATLSGGSGSFLYNWSNGSLSLNQSNLGPGSYSITVTDGNGCTDSARVTLLEPQPLQVDILASNPTCFGSFNGMAVAAGFGGSWPYSYNWSSGSNNATAQNLESGLYTVTVTDNNGCSMMSSVVLDNPPPIEILTPINPIELTLGGTAILDIEHNVNQDSVVINWSPEYGLSCTDCEDPAASPYHTTEYSVTVTNVTDPNETCSGSTIIEIIVVENLDLFVPNAFTPNGDGDNDVFNMYSESMAGIKIQIFNRIGEKVFETNASNAGWDGYYKGELAPPGVYVYNAEILFISGKTVRRNGTVTLLR